MADKGEISTNALPVATTKWEPVYKSQYEEAWVKTGVPVLEDILGAKQIWFGYEPVKFVLGKPIYTPDFMHLLEDGRIVIMEIKGSRHQRGYRSSRTKLRTAAGIYPFFIWTLAIGNKQKGEINEWEVEFISANMKGKGNV